MSVRRTLSVVGAVLAGTVTASASDVPPADPATVRALLAEIGLLSAGVRREATVTAALRRFQAEVGLEPDGIAGPRTSQLLARCAREARELRVLGLAA